MKTAPGLDRVIGTSRAHLAAATLMSPAGTPLRTLPLVGGRLQASARPGDRWAGTLNLAGDPTLVPTTPAHPLSGFAATWVRVEVGTVVDTDPTLLTAADLIVWGTTVRRTAESYALDVDLVGLAGYVAAGTPRTYTPLPGESCQAMIVRLVRGNRPPGWPPTPVVDTTTAVPAPADYRADGVDAWSAVLDLSTIANVTTYVDAVGRLTIRPPLPTTPTAPVRTLRADVDVTAYQVSVGRGDGFANRVELRCAPVQADGPSAGDVVGVAETTGDLAPAAVGRVTQSLRAVTGTIGQAAADARAAALLAVAERAWVTTRLSVVPDPRLEPDDDIAVVYADGTTVTHRITELTVPLDTAAMDLAVRTFDTQLPGRSL